METRGKVSYDQRVRNRRQSVKAVQSKQVSRRNRRQNSKAEDHVLIKLPERAPTEDVPSGMGYNPHQPGQYYPPQQGGYTAGGGNEHADRSNGKPRNKQERKKAEAEHDEQFYHGDFYQAPSSDATPKPAKSGGDPYLEQPGKPKPKQKYSVSPDEVSTNAVKSLLGMMAQPTTPSRPDQQSSGVPMNAHQQGYVHTSRQRSTASTSSDRILLGQINPSLNTGPPAPAGYAPVDSSVAKSFAMSAPFIPTQVICKAAAASQDQPTSTEGATLAAALNALPSQHAPTPRRDDMQKHDYIPQETGHSAEVSAQTKTDLLKQMLAPKPVEVTKSQPSNKNTKKPAPKKKSLGIDFSKRQKKRD